MPNVGPYIYDVSISGFTRSSIYIYIYDISSLRVNATSSYGYDAVFPGVSNTPSYVTSKKMEFSTKPLESQTVGPYLISDCCCLMSSRLKFWMFPLRVGRGIRCPVAASTVPSNKSTAQNGINQKSIMRTFEIGNIKKEGGARN